MLEALCLLSEMLKTKTYRPSDYFIFRVYEPKERVVMSNSFKDKVVQHSLCDNVLEQAFSRAFIRDNYASQVGRGTHDGLYRLEKFLRSYYFERKAREEQKCREEGLPRLSSRAARYADGWVLKCDISKYFYSIQHGPLKEMVRQYIRDPDVLWLVDIIIGTHRVLSEDMKFKDLGLLIIDEEQRFGVQHKEKIKKLKENVDVLTLTATPIPRTLHMSLIGIRDMSVLEEAPNDRMPIQT